MELFKATTITRKIILEGGLVAIDDGSRSGSGSGVAIGANDDPLIVFKTTSHYDYDHTSCTDFSPDFTTSSKCSACGCHSRTIVEYHNITVDNPSAASKEEEKVELVSSEERKNYPFEGFNISDEALKNLTQLINDYSEWIADELLNHHAGRISVGLPWHLIDEMYIPINCGDEFHWVLAVVVLKERSIRVYESMSRRKCFKLSSEI
ncbi:hypothetical protein CQW23_03431 [Capsicum baccatum]|uniref:Ubiquitin-like protease family profile domain-containing protein n=1 Tax=Capsicum baccatum TaxID=33114 RepID=A0A2G2XBT4_CAPBA|nr:hypothetical protein CQW23_03431 [Capsicum baccatum]